MPDIIRIENLRKVYPVGKEKVVALNNISLRVEQGQICCILGTSGSGKSTLLNQLAGLEKPTKGRVFLGKTNISQLSEAKLARFRQRYVGFVFQSYNLLAAYSAIENVAMPLMFRGVGKRRRNKLAQQMLRAVGLGKRMKHKPAQMSGGQQQRVGIARAFVAKPKIVFADEPTGNLDTKTTREVMELMVNLCRRNHQTLVLVTHDRELALYADRIITLIDGSIVDDRANQSIARTMEEIRAEKEAAKENQKARQEEDKARERYQSGEEELEPEDLSLVPELPRRLERDTLEALLPDELSARRGVARQGGGGAPRTDEREETAPQEMALAQTERTDRAEEGNRNE